MREADSAKPLAHKDWPVIVETAHFCIHLMTGIPCAHLE
jgi:hypothetical protein